LQEIPRRLMCPEQLLDPRPPGGIPGACLIEEGGSLFGRTVFYRFAEKGHDLTLWLAHDDSPYARGRVPGLLKTAEIA
jgi:hypothetical protein